MVSKLFTLTVKRRPPSQLSNCISLRSGCCSIGSLSARFLAVNAAHAATESRAMLPAAVLCPYCCSQTRPRQGGNMLKVIALFVIAGIVRQSCAPDCAPGLRRRSRITSRCRSFGQWAGAFLFAICVHAAVSVPVLAAASFGEAVAAFRSAPADHLGFAMFAVIACSPDHSLGAGGCTVRAEIGRGFSWRRGRGDWGLRLRRGVYVGASGPVAHGGSLAMRPASRAKPAW